MTMTAKPTFIKAPCERCGAWLHEGRYTFSSFTRNHYCIDIDACARRAARRKVSA